MALPPSSTGRGALSSTTPLGTWWSSVPKERWPDHAPFRDYIRDNWAEPFGDRRQEIVFIGTGIDWAMLKDQLDACLIPEEQCADIDSLRTLPDPFPRWAKPEAS